MKESINKPMLRKLSYLVGSGFTAWGLAACSVDVVSSQAVKSEGIYQDYSASFSEDSQSTYFSATFRVGGSSGTTVALDGKSSLVVNGVAAKPVSILGQHYELTIGQGYVPTLSAVWTDANGTALTNNLQIKPLNFTQTPTSPAPLTNTYTVFVAAPGFDASDWVAGRISQDMSPTVLSDGYNSTTGALTFSTTSMATLKPGPAQLTVFRSRSMTLANVTKTGGFASISYGVRTVTITLQ